MVNFGRESTFVLLNILLHIPFCLTTSFKLFNDSQTLLDTYVSVDAASPMHCCWLCERDTTCNSVSFNGVFKQCSLSESSAASLGAVDAPGYSVFYKGMCEHYALPDVLIYELNVIYISF